MKAHFQDKTKGFTIFELLLSVAIISMLFSFSAPVLLSTQVNQTASVEADQILSMVRRAQVLSMSQYRDDSWGINILGSLITMFRGTDFATRDTSFDESLTLSNSTPSATTEFYFSKIYGYPDSAVDVTFTTETTNYQLNLTINEQGVASI